MARPLRIEYDGAVYHVTTRGNARKPIYRVDADRETFLDVLHGVTARYNWICHAYCLMSNHYHVVIETPDGNLSQGMRQLNGVYTQLFNNRHNSVGHIFQGRYKAILIQKESHLLEVCRYVVLNPVRAKLTEKPEQWRWSSYRATAGIGKPHSSLTTEWVLGQFGKRRGEAEQRYHDFVRAGIGREKIWKKVKGQSLLGEEGFLKELVGHLKGRKDVREIPRSQRYLGRPVLGMLFTDDIIARKKTRDGKILDAVERYGYKQREVADHLGLHYTTVSRILNEAER